MSEKTALLVIEMQNDLLWSKRREKFTYDSAALTAAVNQAIQTYQAEGADVIYIAQVFPDTPTNHIVFGYQIEGTEGAKLYEKMDVVSDLYFEKNYNDVYMLEAFRLHMESQEYERILLCGIDECGCIAATAKSAVQSGAKVCVIADAVATRFDAAKRGRVRAELQQLRVKYL